jgi:tetratricopeptide (TPR) repeat protein
MNSPFKYRAFISYSHSDEKWARWLHRKLETYRLPRNLVGLETPFGSVPARFMPVFRDRDELATATNLGATLVAALEQSACQIVICSPKAANSRWVNEEILTFKRLGRADRIFSLVVAGEPGASANPAIASLECFPPALIRKIGPDGELTDERGEPIAADVRPGKDRPNTALLKLLAGMLGTGFDDLRRREVSRRYRRLLMLGTASFAGMVIAIVLAATAWIARNEAVEQRALAEKEAETSRRVTTFLVDLFKIYDPSEGIGSTITAREILDKGAARIETELADQPAIQATLLDTMGAVYTGLGLYPTAIPLMRDSLRKRRGLSGDATPAIAKTLGHLGEALMLSGEYDEAAKRLEAALAIQRRVLGSQDPEIAITLSALADVMSFTAQYEKGQAMIEEALRIRRAAFGDMHPEVAQSLGDLGVNFGERGDFNQAVGHLRQALDMQRNLHDGLHPDLAEAMNNLAWALQGLGEFGEAEKLYRESLYIKRKLLGDAHPEIAYGLSNLAYVLEARGDYRGAEKAYQESLEMKRKLLGESHQEVALGMSNLASVIYAKGDHGQAIELMRAAIEKSRHNLGVDHPDVAGLATNLAYWLTSAGRYDEAAVLLEDAIRARRKVLGNDHPQVASSLTVEANLLVARGRYQEARADTAEALRILAPVLPEDHWLIAMANNIEGAALTGLGRYAQSEKLLLESMPRLAGSPIADLPARGRARLESLYTAWGKPEEAAKYARPK